MNLILSWRLRSASKTPLIPSPGIPKIVSTPQSIKLSTRTSPAVCVMPSASYPRLTRGLAHRFVRRRPTKNDVARNLGDVGDPDQGHCDAELLAKDIERPGDSRLAIGAESIDIASPDEAGACPEA